MDQKYRDFCSAVDAAARNAGYEPIQGRTPTPEEQRQLQQHSAETYQFLEELRTFQQRSRQTRIIARDHAA